MINKIVLTLICIYCATSSANDLSSIFDVKLGSNMNKVDGLITKDEQDRAYKKINFEGFNVLTIDYTPQTKIISKISAIRKFKYNCEDDSKQLMDVLSKTYGNFTENMDFAQKSYNIKLTSKELNISCYNDMVIIELTDNNLEQVHYKEIHQITMLKESLNKLIIEKRILLENKNYSNSLSGDERMFFLRDYRDDVYKKLYSNWTRPSYSKRDWECKVHVYQTDKGDVINVKFITCENDIDFKKSIKDAVLKSSPMPLPKHPSLFNRTVEIKFKVT